MANPAVPVETPLDDCAFPDACECKKRGIDIEAEGCLVPTIVAAIKAAGLAQFLSGPFETANQRAVFRCQQWSLAHLDNLAQADLYRDAPEATAYLDEFRPLVEQIGETLYELGGHDAMLAVYAVIAERYPVLSRHLELAWNGIGDWRD